jgi:hypothetical protein
VKYQGAKREKRPEEGALVLPYFKVLCELPSPPLALKHIRGVAGDALRGYPNVIIDKVDAIVVILHDCGIFNL